MSINIKLPQTPKVLWEGPMCPGDGRRLAALLEVHSDPLPDVLPEGISEGDLHDLVHEFGYEAGV